MGKRKNKLLANQIDDLRMLDVDRSCAEIIMGWYWVTNMWCKETNSFAASKGWSPTNSIKDAWQLVEKVQTVARNNKKSHPWYYGMEDFTLKIEDDYPFWYLSEKEAAIAISTTLLKSILEREEYEHFMTRGN